MPNTHDDKYDMKLDAGNYYSQIKTKFGNNFDNGGVIDGAQLSDDHILKLVYPSYLENDEYANRRITFIASEKSTSHNDTESISQNLEIVKETVQSFMKTAASTLTGKNASTDDKTFYNNSFYNLVSKACITLPLPDRIIDNQNHMWNSETGIIHDIGSGAIDQFTGNLKEMFTNYINGRGFNGKDEYGTALPGSSYLSGAVNTIDINKLAGAAFDSMGMRKPLLNPNYWQNYTGSTPRNFGFEIDFIPQSQKEALLVQDIIKTFKAYSSPSLQTAGVTLLAPHYWDIMISNSVISDMFRMDNLVLTSIAITYGQDGRMSLHGDGMPKHIQMSLSFSESHLTYMQQYMNSYVDWYTDRNSQFIGSYGDDTAGKNGSDAAKKYGLTTNKVKSIQQMSSNAQKSSDDWLDGVKSKSSEYYNKAVNAASSAKDYIQEKLNSVQSSFIDVLSSKKSNSQSGSNQDDQGGSV